MACDRRLETGICGHHQCPFPLDTDHGYECVDLFGGYCEAGFECIEACEFSWNEGDRSNVDEVTARLFPEEVVA